MIVRGEEASTLTGISVSHAKVFQEVANVQGCVILCRAVGEFATGLIAEGYSTKGFHNKAKSCNWGPMAGFVLSDPRFTKALNTATQKEAVNDAISQGALEVPLFISQQRLMWLKNKAIFLPNIATAANHIQEGICFNGRLALEFQLELMSDQLYAVRFREHRNYVEKKLGMGKTWKPVMALRDPHCTLPATSYRSATTADYDLFAMWAPMHTTVRATRYSPEGQDRRMVSHAVLEKNITSKKNFTGEDKHLGNMTERVAAARVGLNRGFLRNGYTGGNMVHHSDEGGRPFVNDIDLPVFAVVPGQAEAYGIKNVGDLREFITVTLGDAYVPMFNPGWMKQLVFHSDPAVARNIHTELMAKISNRR